jgi:hypothetical protein
VSRERGVELSVFDRPLDPRFMKAGEKPIAPEDTSEVEQSQRRGGEWQPLVAAELRVRKVGEVMYADAFGGRCARPTTVTWISSLCSVGMRQSGAAVQWLRSARGRQARAAAHSKASGEPAPTR